MTGRRSRSLGQASRRDVLMAVGTTALAYPLASGVGQPAGIRAASASSAAVNAGTGVALVRTSDGPVRGYFDLGIYTYKGIPYAAPPTGTLRFRPPVRPAAWAEPRPSLSYGPVSPQPATPVPRTDELRWFMEWDDGVQDEDCLRLNVWTPGLGDGARRPVMVWLHGGGFTNGSSQELPAYDGRNLASGGDVVVVSLNHRLNLLGYTDVSEYEPGFASSGTVGMLDIVMALQWVRDNIAAFGGDPNKVTVFGQSGGGGKVLALMAMPAARGLFHRGIVESGAYTKFTSQEEARGRTRTLVQKLGVASDPIRGLQAVPVRQLIENGISGDLRTAFGITPVVNNVDLPSHPLPPMPAPYFADVPLLIGTTMNEGVPLADPRKEGMTREEAIAALESSYKGRGAALYDAAARLHPGAKPLGIFSTIHAVRRDSVELATRMSQRARSPVYNYVFAYQTPVLDGRPRACHCSELPFVFNNTDRWSHMTGGGDQVRRLGEKISGAWVAFARSGNPNTSGMAFWPTFRPDRRATMYLDLLPEVRIDYDCDVLALMSS